jgi:hypothetical protein
MGTETDTNEGTTPEATAPTAQPDVQKLVDAAAARARKQAEADAEKQLSALRTELATAQKDREGATKSSESLKAELDGKVASLTAELTGAKIAAEAALREKRVIVGLIEAGASPTAAQRISILVPGDADVMSAEGLTAAITALKGDLPAVFAAPTEAQPQAKPDTKLPGNGLNGTGSPTAPLTQERLRGMTAAEVRALPFDEVQAALKR